MNSINATILQEITQLEAAKEKIEQRLTRLRITFETLKELGVTEKSGNVMFAENEPPPVVSEQKQDGQNFRQKIADIIKELGRFVHVTEIAEAARAKGEPEQIEGSKFDLKGRISQALSAMKAYDYDLTSVGQRPKNVFWGFNSYLSETGEIKPEHMYKEKAHLINDFDRT